MGKKHEKGKWPSRSDGRSKIQNNYDEETEALPVFNYKATIIETLQSHDTLIIAGETGSGKSTRNPCIVFRVKNWKFKFIIALEIPKYIYQEFLSKKDTQNEHDSKKRKMVGITQPRRLAAVTLAKRVAMELDVPLGREVGYSVRFDDRVSLKETRIKYLTDGMLLREMLVNPTLDHYAVLCLDEV